MPNLRAVPKPAPPSAAELSKEEHARRSLAALGVSPEVIALSIHRDDVVFNALVKAWKTLKRAPTYAEIADFTSPHVPWYTVRDSLYQLRLDGRVVNRERGVNVPLLEGE